MLHIEDLLTRSRFYGFASNELKQVTQKVASTKMVGTTFRLLCVVCVFAWGMVPYIDHTKAQALPLPGWLPYNTTKYYYPTFVFQMVALSITACINSTIDILTWMLITIASAQFDILKEKLKSIDYRHELVTIEFEFKACVKHHKEIVNFVHKIEHTFSKGIFLQFFASVIVICFTGFSIMISNEIGQYFHMSNWYESDLRARRDLAIFLERIKRPVTLTAGGFITLSLTTLTRVR
ncbi:Putative odorant receptor 71a-like Protein [Tribolium castaneum]|uniref:Odorant receptor 71a-like Protein n=1 Tax=Tribolium castaneum TaxID=7070 RepID=D6WCW5_TRICA|nr:Putative odorant receptor 71a-like Protein [Tribolium castaneum]